MVDRSDGESLGLCAAGSRCPRDSHPHPVAIGINDGARAAPGFSVAELVDGNHSIHVAGTHDSVGENGVMRRIRDRVFDGVELIALLIAGLVLVSLLSTGIAMLVVWVKSL